MNAVVKAETKTELATLPADPMLAMIERASKDPAVDIDKFERLMAMKERILKSQAESAFNDAMSDAQSKMGRIKATKENKQTHSMYATYGELDKALRPIYTEHGFALSFDTGEATGESVRVICHVSHKAGHVRSYHVDMPADGKGAKGGDVMTKTHATGSAMTYGMRYLLKMIFNVAIGEDDNDGNGSEAYKGKEYADWRAAVDGCNTHEDFTRVWKEMDQKTRDVMLPYIKIKKSEKFPK